MARHTRTALFALLVAIPVALAGCGRGDNELAKLVPPTWTRTSRSGHIADWCVGSWSECGTVTETYDIPGSTTAAVDEAERRLRAAGWTIERRSTVVGAGGEVIEKLSALDAPTLERANARVGVEVRDDGATFRHVRR
jgi:hypothetical protein